MEGNISVNVDEGDKAKEGAQRGKRSLGLLYLGEKGDKMLTSKSNLAQTCLHLVES